MEGNFPDEAPDGPVAAVAESAPAGAGLDHVARIRAEWARERPDVDTSPQAVIGRLHRLGRLLTARLTAVHGAHGLSEGEFAVLAALRRVGEPFERAPGELAAHTMVTTGAMTKRIDRLQRAGLVTRRRSAADGRGRVVALTPEGRSLIDRAFTEHMRNERELLDALDPREARELERLLTGWLARVEPPGVPATAPRRPGGRGPRGAG